MTVALTEKVGGFKRWQPKEWTPVYEQMVLLHCSGKSNIYIAHMFDRTPQIVSMVLNCDFAKKLKLDILENLRENVTVDIRTRLKVLSDKALERVESIITDDKHFDDSPFSVFDRAIKVLEINKEIDGDKRSSIAGVMNVDRMILIAPEHSQILAEGLSKANEAKLLHGKKEIVVEP